MCCPGVNVRWQDRHWSRAIFLWRRQWIFTNWKGFRIPKTISYCKKWKIWSTFYFGAKNSSPASGNSRVFSIVSPGILNKIQLVRRFLGCHASSPQSVTSQTRAAKETTSNENLEISSRVLEDAKATLSFIILSCEEKYYDHVVSVGHVAFDCPFYCGLSRPMQSPYQGSAG